MHHTVTDGVGGLKLSLSLVDFEARPEPNIHDTVRALTNEEQGRQLHEALEDPLSRDSPLGVLRDAMDYVFNRNVELARAASPSVRTSRSTPRRAPAGSGCTMGLVASLRRQVLVGGGPRSPLLADAFARSALRRVRGQPRGAARRPTCSRGSISDIFVTGVTGALGLYHDRLGTPVEDLRMAMAVSTRSDDSTEGNQFVPARVIDADHPKEPAERFHQVGTASRTLRHEPRSAADGFAAVAAGLPSLGDRRPAAQPDPHDGLRHART